MYVILCINMHALFYLTFLIWTNNAPAKSQRLALKIPNSKHEKPCFEALVRDVQEILTTYSLLLFSWLPLPHTKKWKFLEQKKTGTSEISVRVP